MPTLPHCLPQDITPAQFLNDYWQQQPLLIKNGLPQIANLLEPDDVLGLALEEDVTARLITQTGNKYSNWHIQRSPFTENSFDNLPPYWTVLVQNLEQWSLAIAALWQAFDFIPQWQRDDIMVSHAPKGGSVGMHYDDYDVFLVQGYGKRRWQLGKFCEQNTPLQPNQPLKLITDMGELVFDAVLDVGDVLYVPPRMAHYGVAETDCLTFSFGFRRPSLAELLDSLVDSIANDTEMKTPILLAQHLQPTGEISQISVELIKQQVLAGLTQSTAFNDAIAKLTSTRGFELLATQDVADIDEVHEQLNKGAVIIKEPASKLIYSYDAKQTLTLYANGSRLEDLSPQQAHWLQQLADGKQLNAHDIQTLDSNLLCDWLDDGLVMILETD